MNELLTAFSLLLVIEGILPFLSPGTFRNILMQMLQMDDRSMRISGLVSMVSGVVLLYLVK
jgi:hypothetical protein